MTSGFGIRGRVYARDGVMEMPMPAGGRRQAWFRWFLGKVVGVRGFEPPASTSRT